MAQTESFRTGEEVFSFGDFDDWVMVVSTGTLAVSFPGNQKEAFMLGRGELIGEYALVVGLRRTASIVAAENCTLLSWDHDSFISFLKEHPSVLIHLFKKAVTRLLELEAKLRPS